MRDVRPSDTAQTSLCGTIERVIFHNAENGFTVLLVNLPGRSEPAAVVGSLLNPQAGESVEAVGAWVTDPRRGPQFRADTLRVIQPSTEDGIERYLASGLIKGIGKRTAKQLIAKFGAGLFDVLDHHPERLREIKGIKKAKLATIVESWSEQRAARDVMVFLQSHGIGSARAVRVFKRYGRDAIAQIKANPWQLAADIAGIGFLTADQVARDLGVDPQSPLRARAGISHVLQELTADGHCAFPEKDLARDATALLKIPEPIIRDAIEYERAAARLTRDVCGGATWIYLAALFDAECGTARLLRKLQQGSHPLPALRTERALAWVERQAQITLAPAQREAVALATQKKVLVITGGPGVGKTTIVNCILRIFMAKEKQCLLCAPTGRAAKRLAEATGQEARTIHRLLEFDPETRGFMHGIGNPLDADLVVVDEASMLDLPLAHSLLQAVPEHAALLLVGDVDQLPSVGPGRVLADILESGVVPAARLNQIFRQAQKSRIVQAAHLVNAGRVPDLKPPAQGLTDFYFVAASSPELVQERILQVVTERIPARFGFDPVRDVQVLTPMNRYGLGARNLAPLLQARLNPPAPGKAQIERMGSIWRVGDKVMQIVNNYEKEVFNGDIGFIRGISTNGALVTVEFDGRLVEYETDELGELMSAYAVSIHKSQGSEYPAVVIPVHTSQSVMLQRNLLYTGITRGKRLVTLVGTAQAVALAARRADAARRYCGLAERLRAATAATEGDRPADAAE